jgi:hypothetical protein
MARRSRKSAGYSRERVRLPPKSARDAWNFPNPPFSATFEREAVPIVPIARYGASSPHGPVSWYPAIAIRRFFVAGVQSCRPPRHPNSYVPWRLSANTTSLIRPGCASQVAIKPFALSGQRDTESPHDSGPRTVRLTAISQIGQQDSHQRAPKTRQSSSDSGTFGELSARRNQGQDFEVDPTNPALQ